jgi:hypothetical protein
MLIYKDSWVYRYYTLECSVENGIVYFHSSTKKVALNAYRYEIFVYIPKSSRSYFFPLSEWKILFPNAGFNIKTDLISRVETGFRTLAFPSSKTLFYKPPFL